MSLLRAQGKFHKRMRVIESGAELVSVAFGAFFLVFFGSRCVFWLPEAEAYFTRSIAPSLARYAKH